jgi:hypothetical protein
MLQICIHDRKPGRSGFRPAAQHCSRKTAFAVPDNQSNARIFVSQFRNNPVDPVAALVVHYNHFIVNATGVKRSAHATEQWPDIAGFSEGRNDKG